jgi:hypothetical protein
MQLSAITQVSTFQIGISCLAKQELASIAVEVTRAMLASTHSGRLSLLSKQLF